MPSFKDENDFPDREYLSERDVREPTQGGGRASLAKLFDTETSRRLVNGPVTFRAPVRFASDPEEADTVPSPKDDDGGGPTKFVNIHRPDDGRRQFVRSSNRWPSRLSGAAAAVQRSGAWLPVFSDPRRVIPCIERQTRREVMFAKRRAGGAGSRKRKRRTFTSGIRC